MDMVTARGGKTSEFWLVILAVLAVCFSAYLRAAYKSGLDPEELAMIAGLTGVYWQGRTSLKKAVINSAPDSTPSQPGE